MSLFTTWILKTLFARRKFNGKNSFQQTNYAQIVRKDKHWLCVCRVSMPTLCIGTNTEIGCRMYYTIRVERLFSTHSQQNLQNIFICSILTDVLMNIAFKSVRVLRKKWYAICVSMLKRIQLLSIRNREHPFCHGIFKRIQFVVTRCR